MGTQAKYFSCTCGKAKLSYFLLIVLRQFCKYLLKPSYYSPLQTRREKNSKANHNIFDFFKTMLLNPQKIFSYFSAWKNFLERGGSTEN